MQFKAKTSSRASPSSHRSYTPASSKPAKLARYLEHNDRFEFNSLLGDSRDNAFGLPTGSSPLRNGGATSDQDDEDGEDDEGMQVSYQGGYQNGHSLFEADSLGPSPDRSKSMASSVDFSRRSSTFGTGYPSGPDLGSLTLDQTPRGTKRSRGGASLPNDTRNVVTSLSEKRDTSIPTIANSTAAKMKAAPLGEPDDLILGNEVVVAPAYGAQQSARGTLQNVSGKLCNLWDDYRDPERHTKNREPVRGPVKTFYTGIGPHETEPPLHSATFIGTLLLQLHHPPPAQGKQSLALTTFVKSSSRRPDVSTDPLSKSTAIPKLLVQWLQIQHNPWATIYEPVQTCDPSPPAHFQFWDLFLASVLRGNIHDALGLLEVSTFDCAYTAPQDGQPDGYNDVQLSNIQKVIGQATEVLYSCPATHDDDWHVTGNDWKLFRRLVEQSLNDLTKFAEGSESGLGIPDTSFNSPGSLRQSSSLTHTQKSRRAESRVPWSIYTNLRSLYSILLGRNTEIVALARDWLEAAIGQTIWWSGDEQKLVNVDNLATTRRSLRAFHSSSHRLVDTEPETAYREQIARAFERATVSTGDVGFAICTENLVQLGLASVLRGDVESAIGLMRGWSLPVACAVAEIATLGGWYGSSHPTASGLMDAFDESDLMVLSSYTEPKKSMTRDSIMVELANNVFEKGSLSSKKFGVVREGWEISIALLVRLGDDRMSRAELDKVLRNLPSDTAERTDMVLGVCQEYGMETSILDIAKACRESAGRAQVTDIFIGFRRDGSRTRR